MAGQKPCSPDPEMTMKHHFSSSKSLLSPLYPILPLLCLQFPGVSSFLEASTLIFLSYRGLKLLKAPHDAPRN